MFGMPPALTLGVILIIVGAIFLLIGFIGSVKGTYTATVSTTGQKVSQILGGVLLILGILISVIDLIRPSANLPPTATPTPIPPSVAITSPAEGSHVSKTVTIEGTASNIPNGEQLWILIAVDGVTGYFPQPGPVSVGNDGKWSSRVTVGTDADSGKKFEIDAVLVDKDGKTAIDRYFMQTPNPNYIGINSLQGITIIDKVNAIRN